MEKSKKIKVVTFVPHPNYGTCLQSYALCFILKKMGHDVEFIYNNNDSIPQKGISKIKDFIKLLVPHSFVEYFWKYKRRKLTKNFSNNTTSNNTEVNEQLIIKKLPDAKWAFILNKFPFYPAILKIFKYRTRQQKKIFTYTYKDGNYKMKRIYTSKQYEKIVEDADIFITGSDQIWNPFCCGFDPFMFLEFVKGKKRCIAYSSSISRPNFPPEIEERIKQDLSLFEHIAVREQSSVNLLKKILGRNDIQLVIDPTYLLSAEEWITFGNKAKIEFKIPNKYIFCYFVGSRNADYNDMVNDVKLRTGINNVITISCTQSRINYGNGILYRDGGPYEFIFLLSHASFVCMDSFHATIFALKFKKDFAHILKSINDYTLNSQNERMYDLLTRYHLEYKLYRKDSSSWLEPINWSSIECTTEKEIAQSMEYLKKAIAN